MISKSLNYFYFKYSFALFFIVFYSFFKPSFLLADEELIYAKYNINELNTEECKFDKLVVSQYPVSETRIYNKIKQTEVRSDKCKEIKEKLLNKINKDTFTQKRVIGFNYNNSDINFSNTSLKFLEKNNIFYSLQGANKNFSYNLNLIKESNESRLDNSFLKFYKNNKIYSLGKTDQWWGPSDEISLILSNQADPLPALAFENNMPFKFSKLGLVNYKIFISKLENNREIPNAKILGARVELNKNDSIIIGLSRVAQFGGDNRPENFQTIKNIILGRDNTGRNDSDEPGNQLASIDFKYINKSKTEYFMQIAGEDESGYLPSRTFYNIGFKREFLSGRLSFDYANTMSSSDIENYTYNHFLYKDGYRYKDNPLGANIDADSKISILTYKEFMDMNAFFSLKFLNGDINMNDSNKNYLFENQTKIKGASFDLVKIYRKYKLSLRYSYFDSDKRTQRNNISLRLEYVLKN